jgi:hypothetical protein
MLATTSWLNRTFDRMASGSSWATEIHTSSSNCPVNEFKALGKVCDKVFRRNVLDLDVHVVEKHGVMREKALSNLIACSGNIISISG